jgi:hypothetical protein
MKSARSSKPNRFWSAWRSAESLHAPRVAVLLQDGGWYKPAYAIGYALAPDGSLPDSAATIQRLRQVSDPERIYLDDQDSWINSSAVSEEERRTLTDLHPQL